MFNAVAGMGEARVISKEDNQFSKEAIIKLVYKFKFRLFRTTSIFTDHSGYSGEKNTFKNILNIIINILCISFYFSLLIS
jgi:hypothetical protein